MVLVVQRWHRKTSIWIINRNLTTCIIEISTTTRESFIFFARENIGLFGYSNYIETLAPPPLHCHSPQPYKSSLSVPETQPPLRSLFTFTGMTLPSSFSNLNTKCQRMLSLKTSVLTVNLTHPHRPPQNASGLIIT